MIPITWDLGMNLGVISLKAEWGKVTNNPKGQCEARRELRTVSWGCLTLKEWSEEDSGVRD